MFIAWKLNIDFKFIAMCYLLNTFNASLETQDPFHNHHKPVL